MEYRAALQVFLERLARNRAPRAADWRLCINAEVEAEA